MLDQPTRSAPPKTWLAESILVTLFCCLPFGIVGIIHAAKVESAYNSGDHDGADRASAEAKKWTVIGFWIGIVAIGLYLMFLVGMFFFAASNGALDPENF
ncbi:MAG: CD225/dispanin family protein [Saprospiraceae bacterium]|nr:CD225/dispanin family protein [Saprospiraceae bacterium]